MNQLTTNDSIDVPDIDTAAEARRKRIIEVLFKDSLSRQGEIEVDSDALISEGEDNGCYVSAWVWCDFSGTELDKSCNLCGDVSSNVVERDDGLRRCSVCQEAHMEELRREEAFNEA
jgi:hypothetical protein